MRQRFPFSRICAAFALAVFVGACATKPLPTLPVVVTSAEVEFSDSGESIFSAPHVRTAANEAGFRHEAIIGDSSPTGEEIRKIKEANERNAKFAQYSKTPEARNRMRELLAEDLEKQLVKSGTAISSQESNVIGDTLVGQQRPRVRYQVSPGAPEGKLTVTIDSLFLGNSFGGAPDSRMRGSYVLTNQATGQVVRQGKLNAKVDGKIPEGVHLSAISEDILGHLVAK